MLKSEDPSKCWGSVTPMQAGIQTVFTCSVFLSRFPCPSKIEHSSIGVRHPSSNPYSLILLSRVL